MSTVYREYEKHKKKHDRLNKQIDRLKRQKPINRELIEKLFDEVSVQKSLMAECTDRRKGVIK